MQVRQLIPVGSLVARRSIFSSSFLSIAVSITFNNRPIITKRSLFVSVRNLQFEMHSTSFGNADEVTRKKMDASYFVLPHIHIQS